MRRFLVMALLIVGTMASGGEGTTAYLTNAAGGSESTFTAGTIQLGTQSGGSAVASRLFALNGLVASSPVTGDVTILNEGNIDFKYSLKTEVEADSPGASGSVADNLSVQMVSVAAAGSCPAAGGDWTTSSILTSPPSTQFASTTSTVTLFSSRRLGQTGSSTGASTSEKLCFRLVLGATDVSGGSSSIRLTFLAEQASGR